MLDVSEQYRTLPLESRRFGYFPKKNNDFTGRTTELAAITSQLQGENSGVSVIADAPGTGAASGIVGLGGVGKTQLVSEYFHCCLKQQESGASEGYALQIWLRGSDIQLLSEDIRRLASWLGFNHDEKESLDIISSQVYERLASFSAASRKDDRPGVLWVVNGADDQAVLNLLPKGDLPKKFDWLITSRHEAMWEPYFKGLRYEPLRLSPFSPDDALDYLKKVLSQSVQNMADCTDDQLRNLSENLGYLPLALSLAAAYLNRNEKFKTVTQYCDATNDYLTQFANTHLKNIDGYERTILATWLIQLPDLPEKAVELLFACSYLSGEGIPIELLRAYRGDPDNTDETIYEQVISQLQWLQDYSLIEFVDNSEGLSNNSIRQHPLLQQVLRRCLKRDFFANNEASSEVSEELKQKTLALQIYIAQQDQEEVNILSKISQTISYYSRKNSHSNLQKLEHYNTLLPHFSTLVTHWKNSSSDTTNEEKFFESLLLFQYAQALQFRGNDTFSKAIFEECLKCLMYINCKKNNEEITLMKSITLNSLGILEAKDNAEDARKHFDDALELLKDRPMLAAYVKIGLANLDYSEGNYLNAKKSYIDILKVVNMRQLWINLSIISCKERNYLEAEVFLQKAEEIMQENTDDNDNIDVVDINICRGVLAHEKRKFSEAETCFNESLRLQEKYYGENNIVMIPVLLNLGSLYFSKGEKGKAVSCFEKTIRISPKQEAAYHNMACCFLDNNEKAEENFQKGIQNISSGIILVEYANYLIRKNDITGALEQLEKYLTLPGSETTHVLVYHSRDKALLCEAICELFLKNDDIEKITLPAKGVALYLKYICHKELGNDELRNSSEKEFIEWVQSQSFRIRNAFLKITLSFKKDLVIEERMLIKSAIRFYRIYHKTNFKEPSGISIIHENDDILLYSIKDETLEGKKINIIGIKVIENLENISSSNSLSNFFKQNFVRIKSLIDNLDINYSETIFCGFGLSGGLAQMIGCQFGTRVIAFESPGMKRILEENNLECKESNMLILLTVPNVINTLGEHSGQVFRIYLRHVENTSILHNFSVVMHTLAVSTGTLMLCASVSGGVITIATKLLTKKVAQPGLLGGAMQVASKAPIIWEKITSVPSIASSWIWGSEITKSAKTVSKKTLVDTQIQHPIIYIFTALGKNIETNKYIDDNVTINTDDDGFIFRMDQWPTTLSSPFLKMLYDFTIGTVSLSKDNLGPGAFNDQNAYTESKIVSITGYKRKNDTINLRYDSGIISDGSAKLFTRIITRAVEQSELDALKSNLENLQCGTRFSQLLFVKQAVASITSPNSEGSRDLFENQLKLKNTLDEKILAIVNYMNAEEVKPADKTCNDIFIFIMRFLNASIKSGLLPSHDTETENNFGPYYFINQPFSIDVHGIVDKFETHELMIEALNKLDLPGSTKKFEVISVIRTISDSLINQTTSSLWPTESSQLPKVISQKELKLEDKLEKLKEYVSDDKNKGSNFYKVIKYHLSCYLLREHILMQNVAEESIQADYEVTVPLVQHSI